MATIFPIPVPKEISQPKRRDPNIMTLSLTCLMGVIKTTNPPLQLRTNSYSIQEAKSFNHGQQIDDDQIKIMQSSIEEYFKSIESSERTSSFDFFQSTTQKTLPPPKDVMKAQILTSLNKLTLEKFDEILLSFDNFIMKDCGIFETKFTEVICSIAAQQRIFAPIYSMFISKIISKVPDPSNIMNKLKELCIADLAQMTEGTAALVGNLVRDLIFSPDIVFKIMTSLFEQRTEKSLELLYFMAVPSGEIIELEISEGKAFFDALFGSIPQMKSRIRYLMIDLSDCRNRNWDVTSLMPSTVTRETADQMYRQSMPNEGERILREFIADKVLPSMINQRSIKNILMALLQSTRKVFDNGISIISELKSQNFLGEKIAIKIFRELISTATTPEVLHEYPNIKRRVGSLFVHLVGSNIMQLSHFGSAFAFDIEMFGGLLAEARSLNMTEKIKRSPWMAQMRFRPKTFSHMQLTDIIETEQMTECWVLYDLAACIIDIMNNDEDPIELTEMIENEFPKELIYSNEFAEFITEVIVIFKPKKYIQILSKYVKPHCDAALLHIGRVGKCYNWASDLIKSQIEGFALLFDYNLKEFKRMTE